MDGRPRMTGKLRNLITVSILVSAAWTVGAQDQQSEPTLEDRLAALEMTVTRLEARLDLNRTFDDTSGERVTMSSRVTALERSFDRLLGDIQRVERQSDTAFREAMQARRDALTAQQLARDAANRLR
jgi:hypothetical protein